MSDDPTISTGQGAESEHAWVSEQLGAYLAGGLSETERQRFDAHINGCPACFDAFTEARDADRALQRTLSVFAPAAKFEEQLTAHFRENSMKRWTRPIIRRTGYAAAAAVALAATGVFANYVIRQNGRFNNPLSEQLAGDADTEAPQLAEVNQRVAREITRGKLPAVPGSATQARAAAPAGSPTMRFDFKDAPISAILERMSSTFGVQFEKSDVPLPNSLTLDFPEPLDEQSSLRVANDVLVPQGYAMVRTGGKTWRIEAVSEAKDSEIPKAEARGTTPAEGRAASTASMVADARRLYDAGKLSEAQSLLQQAAVIGPQDENAKLLSRLVEDKISEPRYQSLSGIATASGGVGGAQQSSNSAEHLIPYSDLVVHPDNWPDLARGGQEHAGAQQGVGGVLAFNGGNGQAEKKDVGGEDSPFRQGGGTVVFGGGTLALGDAHAKSSNVFAPQFSIGAGTESTARDGIHAVGNGYVPQAGNREFAEGKSTSTAGTLDEVGNLPHLPPAGVADALTDLKASESIQDRHALLQGSKVASGAVNSGQVASAASPDAAVIPGTIIVNGGGNSGGRVATAVGGGGAGGQPYGWVEGGFDANAVPGKFSVGAGVDAQPGAARSAPANAASYGWGFSYDKGQYAPDGQAAKSPADGPAARNDISDTRNFTNQAVQQPVDVNGLATQPDAAAQKARLVAVAPAGTTTPSAPAAAQSPAPAADSAPALANQLKIIRNGTIEFEVRSFDDTYDSVARIVQEEGGFVSSTSSDKLANGKVRGAIAVRVPPAHLDRFLLSLRAIGDLKSQQISASDVTKEYTDTDSELRGLRTMESRLLDLIKTGKGEVKDLIEAETKLGETRIEIEKLEGQLKYYDNQVSMATITITAYEKDIQTPTAASEQENVAINVETEEVEAQYQAARKILDDAKGRIIESQLNNSDGEHIAAHIVAEVPPEKADFVANQLKGLGKVTSFARDRKETTTGGTGGPPPGVQVEQKDTRVQVELFNLANLAPRETTVLRIAVPDVEATYRLALEQLRKESPEGGAGAGAGGGAAPAAGAAGGGNAAERPVGHIVATNLTGQQPEQMSAFVQAEIRTDQADAILAMVRQSGEVLSSSIAENPDTTNSTGAKRGLQLTLVNMTSVAPREIATVNVAVADVSAAYKDLLLLVNRDVAAPANAAGGGGATQPAAKNGENALLPKTVGRVLSSDLNGQQPEQMTADVRAEIRTDQADTVMDALRKSGELLNNSLTESPDMVNTTLAKRGLQVRFINSAAIPARETVTLRTVAVDVPTAYGKLQNTLQALAAAGNVRIISSVFNQSDSKNVNATLAFEVSRGSVPAVEQAFKDANIDFLSRNITRSTDTAGTLDSKVRFQIDALISADTLDPRRTYTRGMEVDNVDGALTAMRGSFDTLSPAVNIADYNVSRDAAGRTTGHIVIDFSASEETQILSYLQEMSGAEISNQLSLNTQVPATRFDKERLDLTLVGKAAILQSNKGLGQSVRAALTSSTGALLYSLYLVLTGLLFVLPFVLIVWPLMALLRRRKKAAA